MAAPVNTQAVRKQSDRQYTVESRSQPGMLHVVKRVNGHLSCDCEAAYNGQNCWHVASVAIVVNADMKWERARKQAALENARMIVLNRMMGRDDYYVPARETA